MKKNLSVIVAFIFTFIIHGVAFGGGKVDPCPEPPPMDPTGAYVKGYFTAAYDKANLPQFTHYDVHAVLEWDRTGAKKGMVRGIEKGKVGSFDLKKLTKRETPVKEVHLFSAVIKEPASKNLCKYKDEEQFLRENYCALPNTLGVPAAFGLPQAKARITKIKITNWDFCGDLSRQESDAMIRGEVEILIYIPK